MPSRTYVLAIFTPARLCHLLILSLQQTVSRHLAVQAPNNKMIYTIIKFLGDSCLATFDRLKMEMIRYCHTEEPDGRREGTNAEPILSQAVHSTGR